MTLSQLLLILRARYRMVLATLFLTVAATAAISLILPKTYKASATVVLNFKGTDPVSGLTLPAQLVSGYLATQVDIATSRNVALKVVDNLKLADSPAIQQQFYDATKGEGTIRDWLADLLLKTVEVLPTRESSVLEISVKARDPRFAAAVANGFAAAYQQLNLQLKVDPLQKATNYFTDQIKILRANLETAQNRLSKYQQEHGLVSTDNRLDVESGRLNDLSTQLVQAQGQAMEASSRERQARSGSESPDVMSNTLIQNLRASLAQAEAKFALAAQNLDKNHPQYQGAQAEVDKLRAELANNINVTANGVANNAHILRQREAEIGAALAAQKMKVLELNRARDELALLGKEVESAQRAYDTATQRFTQTSLEGQSNQSDIAVLNPAVTPVKQASPKLLLNLVLSVFLGSMLGVAFGIMLEMRDRCVRSPSDLADALRVPVFGTVAWDPSIPRRFGFSNLMLPHRSPSRWKGGQA